MTALGTSVPSSEGALEKFLSWKKSQAALRSAIFPHPEISQTPVSIDAKISSVDEARERVQISSSDSEPGRWIELPDVRLKVRENSVEVLTASGTGYLIEVK